MVFALNKHCACTDKVCWTRPSFGIEGGPAMYCEPHKLEGMVNVLDKRCAHAGCTTQPYFGDEGGPAMYCEPHKLEGMVNVLGKRCEHAGCTTRPCFGDEGGPAMYCEPHKLEGMVNVLDKRCAHAGCTTRPSFGDEGGPAMFCEPHKLEDMVNVVSPRCATCSDNRVAIKGWSCWRCRGTTKFFKAAEMSVKAALDADEVLKQYTSHDKPLRGRPLGMPRFRPDFLYLNVEGRWCWCLRFGHIILEVDEYAHRGYDREAELERVKCLASALGGVVTVLRYNPHGVRADGSAGLGADDDHGDLLDLMRTLLDCTADLEALKRAGVVHLGGSDDLRLIHLRFDKADVYDFENEEDDQEDEVGGDDEDDEDGCVGGGAADEGAGAATAHQQTKRARADEDSAAESCVGERPKRGRVALAVGLGEGAIEEVK
jgi:hypothetical protein